MTPTPNQNPSPELLLIEDDRAFRELFVSVLEQAGYRVRTAGDRDSARTAFEAERFPVVLLDLMLPPDMSANAGLAQMKELLAARPETKVVVSGVGDAAAMLEAVRAGAYDFLTKPVDPDVLLVVVQRALTRHDLERRLEQAETEQLQQAAGETMLGRSEAFRQVLETAERVAATDLPVLLLGESGTGKEMLARFVHARSNRRDAPFVPVNCGALPEPLLESTLFGHTKGAFTGATQARAGLFQRADRGTLFLDEIGDMLPAMQVKLLRALESGELLPVGADRPVSVDVRILSATHQALAAMQDAGTFREDLFWRIRGVELTLPPLRDRRDDIPLLAAHFLNRCASLCADGRPRQLSDDAHSALLAHDWPGNLRELRFEMQRASVLSGERRTLAAGDFSFSGQISPVATTGGSLAEQVEQLERRLIQETLTQFSGNRSRTAEALGLSRQGLLNKIARYGINQAT